MSIFFKYKALHFQIYTWYKKCLCGKKELRLRLDVSIESLVLNWSHYQIIHGIEMISNYNYIVWMTITLFVGIRNSSPIHYVFGCTRTGNKFWSSPCCTTLSSSVKHSSSSSFAGDVGHRCQPVVLSFPLCYGAALLVRELLLSGRKKRGNRLRGRRRVPVMRKRGALAVRKRRRSTDTDHEEEEVRQLRGSEGALSVRKRRPQL